MNQLTNALKDISAKRDETRQSILAIEEKMLEHEQVEIPPTHHFFEGGYGREITIPAGTLVSGKIHKHRSLNILASGELSLLTEEGVKRLKAPYVVVSPPGIKRIGYAHSDCTWICVHGTEETDLEKIENEVIAKTFDEVQELSTEEILKIEKIIKEDELCHG